MVYTPAAQQLGDGVNNQPGGKLETAMTMVRNLAVVVLSVACLAAGEEPVGKPAVVPDAEILEELKSAPKDNRDRVQRIRELYLQAGAAEDDVRLQEVKFGDRDDATQHNVIATKRGESDSVIVVGGHLDKVPPGDGIIDDWSGACLATNLYQTLLPVKTHHTFVFIGFAHEEHGLVGSRAYVASLSDDEQKRIKAMINLEVLGVEDPFIWTNGSTDSLELIAHRVAREHKLPLRDHVIVGVGADSMSFGKVGIPNITFDGLPLDKIRLIHSDQDTYANINPDAYLNAYRFTSRYLVTLDRDLAARPDLLTELDPKTAAKRVDEYVDAEMKRRHIPGCSVAVVRGGEVLVAKGYGMANLELSVAATADSVYQIGSITKQFTATAIMILAEQGKLAIDDPISKYVADAPEAWGSVTVRHLLNHTSGIKSYTSVPEVMRQSRLDRSRDEILKAVRDLPLEFQPGEKWNYNNTGYYLLGTIIEKIAGQSYSDFLQEHIFGPLGMSATRVNDMREIVPNRATGYAWTGSRHRNGDYTSMTWPYSAGAIVSTVKDLAKWDAALYSEKVLPQSVLAEMWTPTKLADGKEKDYGFGWGVGGHRGHRLIGHGGGIPGFATDIARFVDDRLTVIVLANLENSNPGSMARTIAGFYVPDLAVADRPIKDKDPKTTEFFQKVLATTADGTIDPELFTPEMRKEVFPDRMKQAAGFLKQLGSPKSFTLIEHTQDGGRRSYRYKVAFGTTTLILSGTLIENGKIAGLLLMPE
jgi:CubicO group peptidase (beta-lactamase class C family)